MNQQKVQKLTYLVFGVAAIAVCISSPAHAASQQNSSELSIKDIVEIIVSVLGTGFGLFTLWRGIEQYRKDQKWKRAEFVVKEIKEFNSDPAVKKAMLMLDWNQRKIVLSEEEEISIEMIDKVLCKALVSKTYKDEEGGFTREESLVRDTFDTFFDYLERFDSFIETGLVTKEEFSPYLSYWLNILGNKNSGRKDAEFYKCTKQYLDWSL